MKYVRHDLAIAFLNLSVKLSNSIFQTWKLEKWKRDNEKSRSKLLLRKFFWMLSHQKTWLLSKVLSIIFDFCKTILYSRTKFHIRGFTVIFLYAWIMGNYKCSMANQISNKLGNPHDTILYWLKYKMSSGPLINRHPLNFNKK